MKIRALKCLALLAVCAGFAQTAAADPCVTATFDLPMPGATNVVTRRVDVPSPQFPGLWQEGIIGGYFYTLFANGEGVLQAARNTPDWAITLTCDETAKSCTRAETGIQAPADAAAIADRLERCFIAPETAQEVVTAPSVAESAATPPLPEAVITPIISEPEVAPPLPEAAETLPIAEPALAAPLPEAAETAPASEPVEIPAVSKAAETLPLAAAPIADATPPPCGLALIPQGAEGVTIQRLLVLGGANPGRIDGFPGKRTRTAIVQLLGRDARTMPIPDAIAALDQLLCSQSPQTGQ